MFELSPQIKMIEDVVRQFCLKEIKPNVRALENEEMLPYPIIRKLYKQLGIDGIVKMQLEKVAKKRESGQAADVTAMSSSGDPLMSHILLKELSRYAPGLAMSFGAGAGLAGGPIVAKGTGEQIRKYAIPVMTFEKIGAWGLTEPGAGSDAFGSMKTTAVLQDDHWVLNGTKTFITNAPHADIFVVYAKVQNTGLERAPVAAFVLERGYDGLSTGKPLDKMGMRDSPTGEIFLDNCKVPRANLLGDENWTGAKDVKKNLANERSSAPAMALGIVERCIEECVKYAKTRHQFGQAIAEFQAVQHRIARMEIARENVFNLVLKSAWLEKEGKMNAKFACAAKLYASEVAVQVSLDAIQIFGGNGYMKEYPVEKLMRDSKLIEIGAGTSEIQLSTIARELYKLYD